jgi:hypothetical protein
MPAQAKRSKEASTDIRPSSTGISTVLPATVKFVVASTKPSESAAATPAAAMTHAGYAEAGVSDIETVATKGAAAAVIAKPASTLDPVSSTKPPDIHARSSVSTTS